MADRLMWPVVKAFVSVYGIFKDRFEINLPGLGWMTRRLRRERVFEFGAQRMLFDPAVASCYNRLLAGQHNEPETYGYIKSVLDRLNEPATFVDVGASIGGLVVPIAAHPRVRRAIAFEPHAMCAQVCKQNAELNHLGHVEVRTAVVGDGVAQHFSLDMSNPTISGITARGEVLPTVRLDDELRDVTGPLIMLIDVEGAEPLVLRGARDVIARTAPLIVFEYNAVSRQHYHIDEIREILGRNYRIFRLRTDGSLDDLLDQSWNAVAIPHATWPA